MPRTARVIIPNYPHHIIQRGHNRQIIFTKDGDYHFYLDTLQECKAELKCEIHAYCLMNNHVHLIINPGNKAENLSFLMKRIAGRYTRFINKKDNRTGTLWEGRFKSSPISSDNYLLACCRYIELNPLRAGIADAPEKYTWSSYKTKIGIDKQDWIDLDPIYMGMADTPKARQQKYKKWLQETIPEEELSVIRQAIHRNQLTGSKGFIDEVEKVIGKRIEFRGPGRPGKSIK